MAEEILQSAGQVELNNIILVSFSRGMYVSLLDYLVELNIYESIFSPTTSGTITLADSRNLVSVFPLIGEEYIFIDVKTPTLDNTKSIYKTFRIYAVTDKIYAKDGSTLVYQLSFTTTEAFNDVNNPIYRAFEGTPAEIIYSIYVDYLQSFRNITIGNNTPDNTKNPLTILDYPTNKIKFVSPGWTPIQCINWIASKSLPESNKAANYLFWETTKGFYFGNISSILDHIDKSFMGEYIYSESFVNTLNVDEKAQSMYAIKSLNVEKSFDQLENSMTGYLSNRLLDIDLYNKQYNNKDYDHAAKFNGYSHMDLKAAVPLFDKNITRNPRSYLQINYSVPKLHNTVENNFDETTKYVFGNRRSNLIELDNFRMNVVIPGRTDLEVGTLINITMPKKKAGALSEEDKTDYINDSLYSGLYLITELSHKINPKTHFITMTVTKDSFSQTEFEKAGK